MDTGYSILMEYILTIFDGMIRYNYASNTYFRR